MNQFKYMRLFILISIFILLGLNACDEMSANLDSLEIDEIARLIDMEVKDASASSVESCDLLPIGAKPCGGPWGYLVFSHEKSDGKVLKTLIDKYDELDHQRNLEEGRFSTCEIAAKPQLTLRDGTCHGEGNYAWNPGDILRFNDLDN